MNVSDSVHKYQKNQLIELFETYVRKADKVSVTQDGTIELFNGTTWPWLAKLVGNYNSIGFLEAIQLVLDGMKADNDLNDVLKDTAGPLLLEFVESRLTEKNKFIATLYAVHNCVKFNFGVPAQVSYGNDKVDNLLVLTVNHVTGDPRELLSDPKIRAAVSQVARRG